MMVEDRYFFDPSTHTYTVDRYVDDLQNRFGGIDSVLIWPLYPNAGIDNRNQWDLHRDMPGGIPALRQVVADFHRRGVKVFFPTVPWDASTRDIGKPEWQATAELMAEIGADGVNGDTFEGLPQAYRSASDATGHPVAFEPELAPASDEGLMYNSQSWAYWGYEFMPTASKLKWLESRHLIHLCDRWARNRIDNLQFAFFNGVGYVAWENIWGIWNQLTPRDAEALRRVSFLERRFADLLVSPEWEPYAPTLQWGVFATKFPGQAQTLWTLVNRNEYDLQGSQLALPHHTPGRRYFDLWHGVELKPSTRAGQDTLDFPIEGKGFGAVLAVDEGGDVPDTCLAQMKQWAAVTLKSLSAEWKPLPQQIVEMPACKPLMAPPPNMVQIPGGPFEFRVQGLEIEGMDWEGLDVQYPWEPSPRRFHRQTMNLEGFWIDRFPVTNADFQEFLKSTRYQPEDTHNFLKHWVNGSPPPGWEQKPVTWVGLEDARAYAQWAGKRLPHEWEWQCAAQGRDGRTYPWGSQWDPAAVPAPSKGRDLPAPANVDAHPAGASPYGVMDLVGNVWQWTDEFTDTHTRAAILRGGSAYQPQDALWFFPQAYRLDQHSKYLLMAPSKDRSATVGFRCVWAPQ
jgi:formylglycine-generating enzyme required for sulfatase activity